LALTIASTLVVRMVPVDESSATTCRSSLALQVEPFGGTFVDIWALALPESRTMEPTAFFDVPATSTHQTMIPGARRRDETMFFERAASKVPLDLRYA